MEGWGKGGGGWERVESGNHYEGNQRGSWDTVMFGSYTVPKIRNKYSQEWNYAASFPFFVLGSCLSVFRCSESHCPFIWPTVLGFVRKRLIPVVCLGGEAQGCSQCGEELLRTLKNRHHRNGENINFFVIVFNIDGKKLSKYFRRTGKVKKNGIFFFFSRCVCFEI